MPYFRSKSNLQLSLLASAGVGLPPCLLWLCWRCLCSAICSRALCTVACTHHSSQQNKELGWLELFVSLGKRKVKAQMLKRSSQNPFFLFSRKWGAAWETKFVIRDVPAHLVTFHRASRELCCMREGFKGFAWFLMANLRQTGRCFTNTQGNREREVEPSTMATAAAVRTVMYVVDYVA